MSSRTLEEISLEIADLKNKNADLTVKRRKIEVELSRSKDIIKAQSSYMTCLPPSEFRMWKTRNIKAKADLSKIEQEFLPIKKRLRELYQEEEVGRGALMTKLDQIQSSININVNNHENVREPIVMLRDKWLLFAEDQTRVNSMRVMAAQFARELTDILALKADNE